MIHKCGAWTYAARLRESCNTCVGKGCDCCKNTGEHTEHGAKFQRTNVNGDFVTNKERLFAKRNVA